MRRCRRRAPSLTPFCRHEGAEAKKAAEFKAVWDQFKATRENEIIPAVYAGKTADAKKIAASVQAGRLSKMWGIMSCKTR
jgi:hypothetical protein